MPTAVDALTRDSSPGEVQDAISSCISTEVKAGRPQAQAIAMCHSMAERKTGKDRMSSHDKIRAGLSEK
jgi:hypothetical protein